MTLINKHRVIDLRQRGLAITAQTTYGARNIPLGIVCHKCLNPNPPTKGGKA